MGDFGNWRLKTNRGMESMDDQIKYPWQQTIVDAFLASLDDASLKIRIAEQAISARLREPRRIDPSERMALEDGRRALKVLVSTTEVEAAECRVRPTATSVSF
jgi:hypothetical protein